MNEAGKKSKTTGKVMSDTLDVCYQRMRKHLPDVFIPDFVDFISELEPNPPISSKHAMLWQELPFNSDQKQHVIGWLAGQTSHGGEIEYHRDNLNISTRTSYNHWNNPGMALWLAEALGEVPETIQAADNAAYNEPSKYRRSGIVRRFIPFDRILELMKSHQKAEKIIIYDETQLDARIKQYEKHMKKIEAKEKIYTEMRYSPDQKELDIDSIKAIVKKAPEFSQLLSEEKQDTFLCIFDQKLESITKSSDLVNKYSKVASVKSAIFTTLCRCGTSIRQASEFADACIKQYVSESRNMSI